MRMKCSTELSLRPFVPRECLGSFERLGSQGEGLGSSGRLGSFSSPDTPNRPITARPRGEGRRRFGPVSDRVAYGLVGHRVRERYGNL
jgi:hypothetical protein